MAKMALITVVMGPDSAYLSKFLISKGYEVYSANWRSGELRLWQLKELDAVVFRPAKVDLLIDDPAKAATKLDESHKPPLAKLIDMMVQANLRHLGTQSIAA